MPNIILVEDDQMIREIYEKKLNTGGFNTTVVSSGREFLSKVKEDKYDLALLDMVLPEMSGIEILQELKKEGNYNPGMKVFIFSNLLSQDDFKKAMDSGADGYIPKNEFNPSELVEELKRMFGEVIEREKNEEKNKNAGKNMAEGEKKKKILFIEDEKAFEEVFCKKLESEGYDVKFVENGFWGLKEAMNNDFDLIITDMMMPAMTGPEIIAKLKMEEKTKNIPIIVISASSTDEEIKAVQEMGIADFFLKTKIVPSDLSKRVNEILNA